MPDAKTRFEGLTIVSPLATGEAISYSLDGSFCTPPALSEEPPPMIDLAMLNEPYIGKL